MNGYTQILGELLARGVRLVVIGVGGANYYGSRGQTLFATHERDLFLPQDPHNLLKCWQVFLAAGWDLSRDRQPLKESVKFIRLKEGA